MIEIFLLKIALLRLNAQIFIFKSNILDE